MTAVPKRAQVLMAAGSAAFHHTDRDPFARLADPAPNPLAGK